MSEMPLPCVEIDPPGEPRACVLWLHGLGADGHDFEPIVPELGLAPELGVRFVFPHAPAIPVTINMGMRMPAWYDILALDLGRRCDEEGVRRSAQQIEVLLAREEERLPASRIVLAGFSQGGAMALHVGLRHAQRLAGILALSTYLVCEERLEAEIGATNGGMPIFQGHGSLDPLVPHSLGEATRERLKALGHDVEWHSYPIEHAVCLEEIQDIGTWLGERLARGTGE